MDQVIALDKALFLLLNRQHTLWLDPVMVFLSNTWCWLPLYLILVVQIVRMYKSKSWIPLLAIALVILMSDQITTTLMKPFFARVRPSHEPSLVNLIHLVNGYKGGLYGFASSHAANTFGVATFLSLLFQQKPWHLWLFVWPVVVSYSRIYLGVHYPGDILAGAIVGILCGWVAFILYKQVSARYDPIPL